MSLITDYNDRSSIPNGEINVRRDPGPFGHTLTLLDHMYVEDCTLADWDALSDLHYKGHSLAAGSRAYRCVYDDGERYTLVGICIFCNPMPLNRGRNEVYPNMKPNRGGKDTEMINKARMAAINKLLTWNNRTVIETVYRNAGLSYRFKNLAYRMYCQRENKRIVESNSSMGKFNPFSIKAGMRMTIPKAPAHQELGLDFFIMNFRSHPCDQAAILAELGSMPEGRRRKLEESLRKFYYKNSAMEKSGDNRDIGMTRVNKLPIADVLKWTIQIVFNSTIYWSWENPDFGSGLTFPKRIPILAFDNQRPNEKFNFDALERMTNG